MPVALLTIRLVLAGVFVVAGIAKVADFHGFRESVEQFGVPGPAGRIVARGLPVLEIAVGLLLVWSRTAEIAAAVAAALLFCFAVVVVVSMVRGRSVQCHCFGGISSQPVGWRTVVRNAVHFAAAILVAVGAGDWAPMSLGHELGRASIGTALALVGLLAAALAIAFLAWFAVSVVHQNGRMLARIESLEAALGGPAPAGHAHRLTFDAPKDRLRAGALAPDFAVHDLSGEARTLATLLAGRDQLLLTFLSAECGPCSTLLPEVADWQRATGGPGVAVIASGSMERNRANAAEHGLRDVLLTPNGNIAARYGVLGTPAAVMIRQDGTLASEVAVGAREIRELVAVLRSYAGSGVSL
jgi:uncharacterized membrane protein YphA (DoxX/SURF4 family)